MLGGQGQILVLIVILIIGMIFGAAVAWWIAGNRKPKPAQPEEAQFARTRALYTEQAQIWRERTSGKIGIRVGDQIILSARQLNEAQYKALQLMTRDWCDWMEMPLAAQKAPEPAQPQPGVLITPQPVVPPAQSTPISMTESSTKNSTNNPPAVISVVQIPGVPAKPMSIVEQIDEILQAKLATSPLHNKGVRLVQDPVKGVVVWVGLEHFDGVDQVTDPDVKALLRESAAEWEKRALPGQKK